MTDGTKTALARALMVLVRDGCTRGQYEAAIGASIDDAAVAHANATVEALFPNSPNVGIK